MNRRTFLKNIAVVGIGALISPFSIPEASAAWNDNESYRLQLNIVNSYLSFKSLENRTRTDAIIIHHIGNTNADVSAARIHEWHLANGWAGIGYHFVIRKNGMIEQGRPMDAIGAHCYGENSHTVGVNLVGNFMESQPEAAQMTSGAGLIAALCRVYKLEPSAKTVFGHRDFNATACPGDNLYARLPELIEQAKNIYYA